MADSGGDETSHALRGPIDRPALIAIREVVTETEPLVTAELDDFLNPSRLEIPLDDGLCEADSGRIDVRWTTAGDYAIHYTDDRDVDLRWTDIPTAEPTWPALAPNTTTRHRTRPRIQQPSRIRASDSRLRRSSRAPS